jgi:dTDP-4-dehydrorhamnose reductase
VKILVLGASGMLGSTMFRVLSQRADWSVAGAVRAEAARAAFAPRDAARLIGGVDLAVPDAIAGLFRQAAPDVVVNCAGLTKHLPEGNRPLPALMLNAVLPHRLAELCGATGVRLIHISTDCVFSGRQGNYRETDPADAEDVYGKTKHLGEVAGPRLVTLRTSTIGHEISTRYGLLEWFLAQTECKGYRRAIFSGLPTVELSRVIRDLVIPDAALSGLYHVGADAIDKNSLLNLIAREYGKNTVIVPDDSVVIDRSLNSDRFAAATGYRAPGWPALISQMRQSRLEETH